MVDWGMGVGLVLGRGKEKGKSRNMLGGQEACAEGAMILKAAVRRYGHKGAHKGAHQQVLMHA